MIWEIEALKILARNETVPGVALMDAVSELEKTNAKLSLTRNSLDREKKKTKELRTVLQLVLDHVDYTSGACGLTEMVGGALPSAIIDKARAALKLEES